jgi:hypothetical protein
LEKTVVGSHEATDRKAYLLPAIEALFGGCKLHRIERAQGHWTLPDEFHGATSNLPGHAEHSVQFQVVYKLMKDSVTLFCIQPTLAHLARKQGGQLDLSQERDGHALRGTKLFHPGGPLLRQVSFGEGAGVEILQRHST